MNKRAIVIGTPYASYSLSLSEALRENGVDNILMVYPVPNIYLKNVKFISALYEYFFKRYYCRKFLKECIDKGSGSDFLILFGMNHFSNDQLLEIKKKTGVKIVLWFIDSIKAFPDFYRAIAISDFQITYNRSDMEKLVAKGGVCVFAPLAYDNHYYHPVEGTIKKYDLYFIGSLKGRVEFFEQLFTRLSDQNLKIRIDGKLRFWFKRRNEKKYPLFFKYYWPKNLNHKEINDVYNASRLCLNIQPPQAETGFSIRTFEICGAGAVQLTNGNRQLLDTLFDTENDLIYYNKIDDLANKIIEMLKPEKEKTLEKIAANGFLRASSDHTFKRRVKEIISFISIR